MRVWKVILAAAVIFAAGIIAGGVSTTQFLRPATPPPFPFPPPLRDEYIEFVSRELSLTPEQRQLVAQIVGKSQERVRILFDLISPDLREELRLTREEIRAHLTPEQQSKFDKLPTRPPRWGGGPTSRDGRRGHRGGPRPAPDPSSNRPSPPSSSGLSSNQPVPLPSP